MGSKKFACSNKKFAYEIMIQSEELYYKAYH